VWPDCAADGEPRYATAWKPQSPPWKYSPSGAIVEVDEDAVDRQAAAAESRTVQLEVQGADRAVEVGGRREQQRAVAEETRRLTPPLVSS
jgi:hypothetical protein